MKYLLKILIAVLQISCFLLILGGVGIFIVGMTMNLANIYTDTAFYKFFNDNVWGWVIMFGSPLLGFIGIRALDGLCQLLGFDSIIDSVDSGSSYSSSGEYSSSSDSGGYGGSYSSESSSGSPSVESRRFYDGDGNSVGYKVGDRYYDCDGSCAGYDVGDRHYDSDGNSTGYRVGDREYDSEGNSVGYWVGDSFYDSDGNKFY